MIEAGDVVRFKNKYIAAHLIFAPGQRRAGKRSLKNNLFARLRGKQKTHRVIILREPQFEWRTKKWNQLAVLDNGKTLSVHWLVVVRKATIEDRMKTIVPAVVLSLPGIKHTLSAITM